MLQGRLDRVTEDGVNGWAAREDDPDGVIEVSIFVDGTKVGQIACNLPRPDLRKLGNFGKGEHGFRFMFATPIATDADHRVTVRFADTGRLLNLGDVLLSPDGGVRRLTKARGGVTGEPQHLPAPRDTRMLFELLALVDGHESLYDLLSRLSLGRADQTSMRRVVFNDFKADDGAGDRNSVGSSAFDYMSELLMSDEFQATLIPNFLRVFPEKRRLIFVHVPKCAGSDLTTNLTKLLPSLQRDLTLSRTITKEELFLFISRLVRHVRCFDKIFVAGHTPLDYYISQNLVRPSDKIFTVLRDPVHIVVSQINYILTRFVQDAKLEKMDYDTKRWLSTLGMEAVPTQLTAQTGQDLCRSILYNKEIVRANAMCGWLGGRDAGTAMQQLAACNVEITTTENYTKWALQSWGIVSSTRINRSEKFTSTECLSPQDTSYIHEMFSEDIKLFDAVSARLRKTGDLSIWGSDLGF
jgi:hypothetical protein